MKKLLFALSFFLCLAAIAQPRFTDSTFGTNGKIVKNTSVPYKYIIGMVLQTDGKAVILAEAEYNTVSRIVLIRYNTNGALDNTFSGNGIADSMFRADAAFRPTAIKLQPDGKILVSGGIDAYNDLAFVARYNTNGSLDATFANGGIFYEPPIAVPGNTLSVYTINHLAVLPGGKLMLLSSTYGGDFDLILTRLNPNGKPDSTFGIYGIAAIDASPSFVPEWIRIEVQADGKLLVGGHPNEFDNNAGVVQSTAVLRFNTNGTFDSSYGIYGRVYLHIGTADYSILKDLALQPDGKVVINGQGTDYNDNYFYGFTSRLSPSGVPDNSFGNGGSTILYPAESNPFYGFEGQMSLQADGKILLAGCSATATGSYNMALARLTTTGQPDISFDNDGYATLAPNAYSSLAFVVRQQADGKLLLGSLARNGTAASTTIARLTATGQADATLNTIAAVASIGSGTNEENGISLQLQPDGKIININGRYNGAGYDLAISRYTATGAPDATWGTSGTTLLEMTSGYNEFFSSLLPNGKLMLASGYGDYFIGSGILLSRLQPNGSIDSSFGINGRRYVKTRSKSLTGTAPQVAFQPDGKIILLYAQMLSDNYTEDSTFVVRLNADGSLDNAFNGNGKRLLSDSMYTYFTRLCLQPDGKPLVLEQRTTGGLNGGRSSLLYRLTANGGTDTTFNNGIAATVPFESSSIGLQADGKIVVGGTYSMAGRLTANGTPDSSFGTAGTANLSAQFPYFYNPVCVKEADSSRIILAGNSYDTTNFSVIMQLIALKKNGTADSTFGVAGAINRPELRELLNQTALAVQPDGKILLTGYKESATVYYSDAVLSRLKPVIGRTYRFTGSGLWSSGANWSEGTVPPSTITTGNSVVIDPPTAGECVIDIPVRVQPRATLTVRAGKKMRLPGNLLIQ